MANVRNGWKAVISFGYYLTRLRGPRLAAHDWKQAGPDDVRLYAMTAVRQRTASCETSASQQLYTPAAQRLVVRRATPATLTGVNGRPTLASAGEIRLNGLAPVNTSAAPSPMTATIATSSLVFSFLDKVISLLRSCNSPAGR